MQPISPTPSYTETSTETSQGTIQTVGYALPAPETSMGQKIGVVLSFLIGFCIIIAMFKMYSPRSRR